MRLLTILHCRWPAYAPPTTDPKKIEENIKAFEDKNRFPTDESGGYDRHKDMAEMESMVHRSRSKIEASAKRWGGCK